ncbi:EthD family reductase [soil metagenome]
MTTFLVTYPLTDGARFDADYYVAKHMPLVRESWVQYGLTDAKALIPDQTAPAYAAVAVLDFADGAALDAALASAEASTVFGDVANFTDIAPIALRCEAR